MEHSTRTNLTHLAAVGRHGGGRGSPARNPAFRGQQCRILCAAKAAVKTYKGPIKANNIWLQGFPDGPVIKNPPANARDTGLIPAPGRLYMAWNK